MGGKRLPPGFRFHPTDVELVLYYLKRKVLGKRLHFEAIAELDIYQTSPWDLPDKSIMKTGDLKWYFFCPRGKKYSSGSRVNRATDIGYWKTTGKDRPVSCKNEVVGMIKTLVFHTGKAPKGDRTDWVMYEYRLAEKDLLDKGVAQDSFVLCSIFKKDGPGPKNGAQYGKPFNEEDWDDDDDDGDVEVDVMNCIGAVSFATLPVDQNQNQAAVSGLLSPEALPSTSNTVSVVADYHNTSVELVQDSIETDDIDAMLAKFTEQYPPAPDQNDVNEQVNIHNQGEMENDHNQIGNNGAAPFSDGFDIFEDLGDLGNLGRYNKHRDGISASHNFAYSMEETFGTGNDQFLELMDLDIPLSCCPNAEGYEIVQTDLHNFADHSSSVELVSGSGAFGMGATFVGNGSSQGSFNSSATFCQTSDTRNGQTSQPIQRGSFQ